MNGKPRQQRLGQANAGSVGVGCTKNKESRLSLDGASFWVGSHGVFLTAIHETIRHGEHLRIDETNLIHKKNATAFSSLDQRTIFPEEASAWSLDVATDEVRNLGVSRTEHGEETTRLIVERCFDGCSLATAGRAVEEDILLLLASGTKNLDVVVFAPLAGVVDIAVRTDELVSAFHSFRC